VRFISMPFPEAPRAIGPRGRKKEVKEVGEGA
jgi:hypothetical protein